jgi:dihydroorotate dehydrogenase electron transfer subunit
MKKILDMAVIKNQNLNKDYYYLELKAEEELPKILPGQFAQIKINNSESTFLRRPFSIHDVDYEKNTIALYIKRVGEGSKKLGETEKGKYVNAVLPLGNSFLQPEHDDILLIAGGCGMAPIYFFAKYLRSVLHIKPKIIVGGRTRDDILRLKQLKKFGEVFVATEDGSQGEKGLVTDHLKLMQNDYKMIYACGPDAMLKAVAKHAKNKNIECEVSLENMMACGFGACLCCVTETREGNVCVCTEGPVFNIKDLKWLD